jgi:hypothetical protein
MKALSSLTVDNLAKQLYQHVSQDLTNLPFKLLKKGKHTFDLQGSILNALQKKYKTSDVDEKILDEEARSNFVSNCIRLDFHWLNKPRDPECARDATILKCARSIISGLLPDLDEESWFAACRNGPGTTKGTKFVNTSWEAKFTYPITGTRDAIVLFERLLAWDPQLEAAIFELNRFNTSPKYKIVRGSTFQTVPKDNTKNRNIAIEPTINMFLQQGLMFLFSEALNSWGLCLDKLPLWHQYGAMESSITLRNSTLDCKGASDSVHLKCVSALFPPMYVGAINTIRCKDIEVRKDHWIELPIVSTMGNATTFPLETIVFYALSVATVHWESLQLVVQSRNTWAWIPGLPSDHSLHSVSVFGDDILCPTDCAESIMRTLGQYGFQINTDKSFFTDYPFRESCGGDYFDARDVRPFFLERPTDCKPESVVSWCYHIWNSLSMKYMSYFGPHWVYYAVDTLQFLANTISEYGTIRIVPDNFPTTSGIIDPDIRLMLTIQGRWAPLIVDNHGTVIFEYLKFDYLQKNMDRANLYLSLYKALKGASQVPKWIKRRTVGRWIESYSIGTLDFLNVLDLNNIEVSLQEQVRARAIKAAGPWSGPVILECEATPDWPVGPGSFSTILRKFRKNLTS